MSDKYNAIVLERPLKGLFFRLLLVIGVIVSLSLTGCGQHKCSKGKEGTLFKRMYASNHYQYNEAIREKIRGYEPVETNWIPDKHGNISLNSEYVGSNIPMATINSLVWAVLEVVCARDRKVQRDASPYHLLIQDKNPSEKFMGCIAPKLSEAIAPGLEFNTEPPRAGTLIKIGGIMIKDNRAIVRFVQSEGYESVRGYTVWFRKEGGWLMNKDSHGWCYVKIELEFMS